MADDERGQPVRVTVTQNAPGCGCLSGIGTAIALFLAALWLLVDTKLRQDLLVVGLFVAAVAGIYLWSRRSKKGRGTL